MTKLSFKTRVEYIKAWIRMQRATKRASELDEMWKDPQYANVALREILFESCKADKEAGLATVEWERERARMYRDE